MNSKGKMEIESEKVCGRCKTRPLIYDSNICAYCTELWNKTLIDSSFFYLNDINLTNKSAQK